MGLITTTKKFKNSDFDFLFKVSLMSNSYMEYISLTEKLIDKEVVTELRNYEKFIKESEEYEIEQWYDHGDHFIKENVANLYYTSILISLYSFLERNMHELCKSVENEYKIRLKDLNGKGIFQFRNYLEKVVEVDFEPLNDYWNEITKINKLRNLIVHESVQELQKTGNSKKIESIKQIHHLTIIDKEDSVSFEIRDSKILMNFLTTIINFLDKIFYKKVNLR